MALAVTSIGQINPLRSKLLPPNSTARTDAGNVRAIAHQRNLDRSNPNLNSSLSELEPFMVPISWRGAFEIILLIGIVVLANQSRNLEHIVNHFEIRQVVRPIKPSFAGLDLSQSTSPPQKLEPTRKIGNGCTFLV
jgi:hypothetical protein